MSAAVDSERKGHKRKLADTFTYSSAVAGHTGGERETVSAQVWFCSLLRLLEVLSQQVSTYCLQVRRLLGIIKACTQKSPDTVDRVVLRRAAHSLAELSKSGE